MMAEESSNHAQAAMDSGSIQDLTLIKGIGPKLAVWFREVFKINTFAELAALPIDTIVARAKGDYPTLSRAMIEHFQMQARELAQAEQKHDRTEGVLETEPKAKNNSLASPEIIEWKQYATFVVNFEHRHADEGEEVRTTVEQRTAIHHMETSEQYSWPGIETEQVCEWMLQRLGEKNFVINTDAIAVPETSLVPTDGLKIQRITVSQPRSNRDPQNLYVLGKSQHCFVSVNESLTFEVSLAISGNIEAAITSKQREFKVAIYAIELSTLNVTKLDIPHSMKLEKDKDCYRTLLYAQSLPAGAYKLRFIATIFSVPLYSDYIEDTLLQVA